jgi:steroid delta-isomerase-like uncharacterized protein
MTLTTSSLTQAEQHKALFLQVIDQVFNQHDLAAADRYYPIDYIQHNPEVAPGRDGFKQFFGMIFQAFPDWTATIEHLVVEGDMLMTFISWTGTHRDTFMGIPATGQQVTIRTADLFRIENNQLVEHWDVVENMTMMAQIGAIQFTNAR